MKKGVYAVIDTNVLVASLLTKNRDSATFEILACIVDGKILPVFNNEILTEYVDVLNRPKFKLNSDIIDEFISMIIELGLDMERTHYPEDMPDPDDRVFYEVSLTGDSYLVTGNKKHFPITPKVVTPAEMIAIIKDNNH